jgi:zinc transport system permease protein
MQRALLAALLLAPICALLGVFVTARRMSFFSDTIAHGALTGVALGAWLGLTDFTVPMILVGLTVAAAIIWLKDHTDLLTDTIMALLLSGSVAAGILILRLLRNGRGQIDAYLFGDILAIDNRDVIFAGLLFLVAGFILFTRLSAFSLITAHEEMAFVTGIRVRALNYAFILLLTITVALSIRLLGIILVTSLLVIPPAAARNLSRNLRQHLILSLLIGALGGVSGIVLSYQLDAPCGPAIVLSCIGLFILSLLARPIFRRPKSNEKAPATLPA